MGAPAEPESELKFESPPVQQVILGIYFQPLLLIGALQLLPILNQWREDYPMIEELRSTPPWRPLTDAERQESSGRLAVAPLFVLVSPNNQRTIHLQYDRIILTWRFEAEGSSKEYVGYQALRAELARRTEELISELSEKANVEVKPERIDITYQNLIDMTSRDFCVGVLTAWSSTKAAIGVPSGYSGMRFEGFEDDEEHVDTLVAIEDGPDGEGTDLTIDVDCDVAAKDSYIDALDEAHDVVVRLFERFSSAELMASWGRR